MTLVYRPYLCGRANYLFYGLIPLGVIMKYFKGSLMIKDFLFALRRWRLVHLLSMSTLRARYARSKFGQSWLAIATAFQVLCTGLVWSLIWRVNINEYLPYVGVGQIVYMYLSQTIVESTGVFVADSRLYLNDKLPFMVSIVAHIYRNILIFLHNIPIIILLLLWSSYTHIAISLSFFEGVFLSFIFLTTTSYVLATICTRFRDVIQLVSMIFQLVFLVTPIMWKVSFLPEPYQKYAYINPFSSMLELIRNPLIGLDVSVWALPSLAMWTLCSCLIFVAVYSKMDRDIIYWV